MREKVDEFMGREV